MNYASLDMQKLTTADSDVFEKDFDEVVTFVSTKIESLLQDVSDEGFPLLLMHLFPFFQYPRTSFDAVHSFLPPLAQNMSKRSMERVFSAILIRLFDTATEPHQRGQLFSRTTADIILKRFGLSTFLNRFLVFLIEAVVEPLRMSSKALSTSGRINKHIVRMKSQSVLTILHSQVYERSEGHDLAANLSYSLAMTDPSYDDSDKESFSSEDSEEDMVAESSLLAKSSMLSGESEGVDMAHHQSPLLLAAQTAATETTPTPADSTPSDSTAVVRDDDTDIAAKSDVATRDDKTSGFYANSQEKNPQLMASYQDSVSLLSSLSQFDPTQSLASVYSEESFGGDISLTSSLPPSSVESGHKFQFSRDSSLPVGIRLGLPLSSGGYEECEENVGGEDKEVEDDTDTLDNESISSHDPQALAVNLHVSQVAGDCLSWLVRRLGPLLASQHIIRPLIENLYRCFSGILHLRGREVSALKCLSSFAECYGETVIRKMYVPHAENMVRGLHFYKIGINMQS